MTPRWRTIGASERDSAEKGFNNACNNPHHESQQPGEGDSNPDEGECPTDDPYCQCRKEIAYKQKQNQKK